MNTSSFTNHGRASIPDRENELSRPLLRILTRWVPVGREYFADWPVRPNCGHFLGGVHWYGEETALPVLAFAAVAASPEFDESVTGISRDGVRLMALKGIRYLCFTHDSGPVDCVRPSVGLGRPENLGTKWGERGKGFFPESQCGTTVATMTMAALLLGDLVDEETWSLLAAVNEDYAERFGEMEPRSGVYDNTQMEENGWTSLGLASAASLLAKHPKAEVWEKTAKQWMFSTAVAPQDLKNHAPYDDGRTVAQWTLRKFTTLPDYMAENHGMVHPSYTSSSIVFTGDVATVYGLFGREVPKQALFNRREIYDRLKGMTDRTGELHPAQGMDWPYHFPADAVGTHVTAAAILEDPEAVCFALRAIDRLARRQQGNGGRMIGRQIAETCHDIQDPMIMRESTVGLVALAYLIARLFGPGPEPTAEGDIERKLGGVRVYPHAGFVFHRHPKGQTSLSWRNVVMALPLTSDGIYTVAPATNSLLGVVTVKDRPDSHDLVSLRIDEHRDSFAAALVMDRAQRAIRQEVLFASLPNGTIVSWERLRALEDIVVERVEQGFLRIVNEHFPLIEGNCDGVRTLYRPGGAEEFTGFPSADPKSDVIRTYRHPAWVNLDDRLGIVFRGTGTTVYHNRHHFSPWWATADDLVLSRIARTRAVKAGRLLSELVAVIAPDEGHRKTARRKLIVLSCRKSAMGVIVDGCLVVCSFSEKRGRLAFSAASQPGQEVPVFPGNALVTPEEATYFVPLEAGAALLRPAVCGIVAEGTFDVIAEGTGQAFAMNTGDEVATITTTRTGQALTLQPGHALPI